MLRTRLTKASLLFSVFGEFEDELECGQLMFPSKKGALWPSYSAPIREDVAKRSVGQNNRLTHPAFVEINQVFPVENRRCGLYEPIPSQHIRFGQKLPELSGEAKGDFGRHPEVHKPTDFLN